MTHSQFFALKKAIDNVFDTGVLPKGIPSIDCFREFERLAHSYLEGLDDSTIDSMAVSALEQYGLPLKRTGIGWKIEYKKKGHER